MLQNLLSKFIPALCQEIANPGGNESDSVILDIASGYHSYMLDISKNCKEKVCMHQSKHFVNCLQLINSILIILVSTILADK